MKKILITGANSYIGTSFENYMKKYAGYEIDTVDMQDQNWRDKNFGAYDTIFHVAGIAHIKETKENAHLYYEVNRDLAIETAKKSKRDGAKQFIFLSSMSVYGMVIGLINENTIPKPNTNYGKSKFEAELEILKLSENDFKVSVVRPPMVYGSGCKGNYRSLSGFAKKTPVFIKTNNRRSMIYIYNLCEFIYKLISDNLSGVFCPQNSEYVSTDEMVKQIAQCYQKKVLFLPFAGSILKLFHINKIDKIIGDLIYEKFDYGFEYNVVKNFDQTIVESEGVK